MSVLRFGLVGCGQMGHHHARVLSTLPGVELVAITDPSPPARTLHRLEKDLDALLRRGIDCAVVAVPTSLHEETAVRLAEAGVHALVEKPVAPDVAAGLRMAAAFDKAGVIGCVGHIERFNPAVRELRRRMDRGELGEVYQIVTRRQGPFPERIVDLGVILDLATHDIDLTSWVSRSNYQDVSVRTAQRSGRRHEDLVAAVGRLEDGTVVSHLVNWLSPLKERVTVVSGEHGCFVADTLTADLTFFTNGVAPVTWDNLASFRGVVAGDVTRFAIAKREPLAIELEAFRDAVLGADSEVVTLTEASRVVGIAETMLAAAETSETERPGGAH